MCLDQKPLKITTIKLHNKLALPVLLYGSETGTVKASVATRITAVEMKYMRRTAGYTWDRLQNKCTNSKGVKNNTNFGQIDGLCGLMVRVSGYRYRGPGFDPRRYQIF